MCSQYIFLNLRLIKTEKIVNRWNITLGMYIPRQGLVYISLKCICRFHESHGKHYSPGYGEGDTLGFLICLPDSNEVEHIPNTYKDRVTISNKYITKNAQL